MEEEEVAMDTPIPKLMSNDKKRQILGRNENHSTCSKTTISSVWSKVT
jgi:hypothetical protein